MSYDEMLEIMQVGHVDVDCTNGCGNSARVEPDGDYPCDCGGRLVSPIVLEDESAIESYMRAVGGTL
mgnify:CR=1 FL=1